MRKCSRMLLLLILCAACLAGCGVKDEWDEDRGELVRMDQLSLFLTEKKQVDIMNLLRKYNLNRRKTNESKRSFAACIQYSL